MADEKKPKHVTLGERELRWFHTHKAELEAEHPGEWVAIGPDGMVSVGKDLVKVMDEAAARGFPEAIAMGIRAKQFQGKTFIRSWRTIS